MNDKSEDSRGASDRLHKVLLAFQLATSEKKKPEQPADCHPEQSWKGQYEALMARQTASWV